MYESVGGRHVKWNIFHSVPYLELFPLPVVCLTLELTLQVELRLFVGFLSFYREMRGRGRIVTAPWCSFFIFLVKLLKSTKNLSRFEPGSFRMWLRRPKMLRVILVQSKCCWLVPASQPFATGAGNRKSEVSWVCCLQTVTLVRKRALVWINSSYT